MAAGSDLSALLAAEQARFLAARPRLRARMDRAESPAAGRFYAGAPLHWMQDWPMPALPQVIRAQDAAVEDEDGHVLADFCLGDTAAMFGHAPPPVARALARAGAETGLSTMLPHPAAERVPALLAERFGLPVWQIATSASDANRFALKLARAITGRSQVLVFDGCYHGAVEETLTDLSPEGLQILRRGTLGAAPGLIGATRVVPFNDPAALSAALADRAVAAVLAEPAMTNCSMIPPLPGFLEHLRAETRAHGTLLIGDETHCLSSGPGGLFRVSGVEPDILVVGKAIGGGIPVAVWGMSEAVAGGFDRARAEAGGGHSGIGTTLAGSALQLACLEACLTEVATPEAMAAMERGAQRLAEGLRRAVAEAKLPWWIERVGARVEPVLAPEPNRNAAMARAAMRPDLEQILHLGLVNRGVLVTPFHLMMLVSPVTEDAAIDRLIAGFADLARLIAAAG